MGLKKAEVDAVEVKGDEIEPKQSEKVAEHLRKEVQKAVEATEDGTIGEQVEAVHEVVKETRQHLQDEAQTKEGKESVAIGVTVEGENEDGDEEGFGVAVGPKK